MIVYIRSNKRQAVLIYGFRSKDRVQGQDFQGRWGQIFPQVSESANNVTDLFPFSNSILYRIDIRQYLFVWHHMFIDLQWGFLRMHRLHFLVCTMSSLSETIEE
jgi:hypothetical protein